jgi:hypothetical protein
MKKQIFIGILGCSLLFSCQNNAPRPATQLPNSNNSDTTALAISDEKVHVEIDAPTDIWQTDYLAFEVSHRENYEGRGSFDYNSSGYKKVESVGAKCWNLLFYNPKTQDYYLLDADKKMLIYNYALNDTAKGKIVRNLARYDIQFDDNQDGKFNNADAKRLFVSNRLGKGFRQVSPENVSVRHYQFAPKGNFIIIYGIKDTNRDGLFDEKDRTFVYRLDMNPEVDKIVTAPLLVPKEFQDKLQKKVETEWQLPKD